MYLNVTDLTTYKVTDKSFCVQWTPHRAATSYRLKINPFDREYQPLLVQHARRGMREFGIF